LCGAKRVAGLKQGTCGWSRLFDIEINDEARDACLGKPRADFGDGTFSKRPLRVRKLLVAVYGVHCV